MTNKEKYKQAFSVLQPSGKISLEEERMIIMKKKQNFRLQWQQRQYVWHLSAAAA